MELWYIQRPMDRTVNTVPWNDNGCVTFNVMCLLFTTLTMRQIEELTLCLNVYPLQSSGVFLPWQLQGWLGWWVLWWPASLSRLEITMPVLASLALLHLPSTPSIGISLVSAFNPHSFSPIALILDSQHGHFTVYQILSLVCISSVSAGGYLWKVFPVYWMVFLEQEMALPPPVQI